MNTPNNSTITPCDTEGRIPTIIEMAGKLRTAPVKSVDGIIEAPTAPVVVNGKCYYDTGVALVPIG